jgi:hypothetical protein
MYRVVCLKDDNGHSMGYEVLVNHTLLSEEIGRAIGPIISEESSSGVRVCHAVVTRVYEEEGGLIETRIAFGEESDAHALVCKMNKTVVE